AHSLLLSFPSRRSSDLVFLVPIESAEGGCPRTACPGIFRRIKDRIAEAQTVDPRLEVTNAHTVVDGQPLSGLPIVLCEALPGVIRDVVNSIEARLCVTR